MTSPRVHGDESNVAIHPDAVDEKIDLIAAGECMLYRYNGKTIVDNLTTCHIPDFKALTTLNFTPITDKRHKRGHENCLWDLGVPSLEYRTE